MTFDENEAYLTNELCGRTIQFVERRGKELIVSTSCGHEVTLQADVNGDIRYKGTGVSILIEPIKALGARQGTF